VSEAHHDEIVRRNYHGSLPAGTQHVIGIQRNRKSAVAIEPEEGTIDPALVGRPRGRERADELGVAFREKALAVPDAVLKIETAEPRPVALFVVATQHPER
jgi:hypothetical protein